MKKKIIRGGILGCVFISLSVLLQASVGGLLNGKVIHQESRNPLDSVKVIVNHSFHGYSDANGILRIEGWSEGKKPEKVSAQKKGYELAFWLFVDQTLQIEMRNTSMIHVSGQLLTKDIRPVPNTEVFFLGKKTRSVTTDSLGHFLLDIPVSENNQWERFRVDHQPLEMEVIENDLDKSTVRLRLYMEYQSTIHDILQLKLVDTQGQALNGMAVMAGNSYFGSDTEGMLSLPSDIAISSLSISGYEWQRTDTSRNDDGLVLVFRKLSKSRVGNHETDALPLLDQQMQDLNTDKSKEIDSLLNVNLEMAVSLGLDSTRYFYDDQELRLNAQNEFITQLTDSLSKRKKISYLDHQRLLSQLKDLNHSIHSSEKAFENTKKSTRNLILRLTNIIQKRDQAIQHIQQEKDALSRLNKENLKLFSAILLFLILLLIMSTWLIRRFKKQKLVIEKTKEQLLEAQELAKVANMVYDYKKGSFFFSDNFFQLLNIPSHLRKEIKNSKSGDLLPPALIDPSEREAVQAVWQNMLMIHEPIHVRFKGVTIGHETTFIEMNSQMDFSPAGKKVSISSTLQNVTDQIENELRLVRALKELESASKIKEQFMASMSHEIRTPLHAIIGLTDHLLSQQYLDTQFENLRAIQFSSKHLLMLVNDLLDYSRIRAGKLTLEKETFDVVTLAKDLIKSMSNQAHEKHLLLEEKFSADLPIFLKGDQLRLTQVLMNLIGNAIKFTDSGKISLALSLDRTEEKMAFVRFAVSDTGIGIEKDKLIKIFEGFEQENVSTVRKYGGSGLGLTISKELVTLMKGEMKVSSKKGSGSEFSFILPLEIAIGKKEDKSEVNGKKEATNQSLKGLRLLCVEDNKINQLVLSQYLKKWEVYFEFANTGSEALSNFDPHHFDLVFMDIRLPDMNGYEVSREIRKKFPSSTIPIIALTAEVSQQAEEKFAEAGMVGFLPKPFTEEELMLLLEKIEQH